MITFLGCITPPAEKRTDFKDMELNPNTTLKIYFPEFDYCNPETGKNEIVQGDGIVLVFPDGTTMVIDSFMSTASEKFVNFIKSLGIYKIDYLFATHYHSDHIGSMPALIANFEIGQFISNGTPFGDKASTNLIQALEKYNINQAVIMEGDVLSIGKQPLTATMKIFWPTLSEKDKYDVIYNPGKTAALKNLTSLVSKLQYGDFSILFPGDVYKKGEKEIAKKYGNQLKSTVMKASHHGEWYTANHPLFVRTIKPEVAVIQDTRYITHVIDNLYKSNKGKILYRLTQGYTLIETDGKNYTISEQSF
ncbi:MAG: MBL fold metallo-hydrolase [Treponema sp.]|nr:MBL fold metallo-hydrolase [Treponema sp.]